VTELSALNAKITGDSNGLTAALSTARKGVEAFQKSAESSAKVFERAFAQSEKSVDQLRRAIDPVYAASKRYEAAVETLDAALKQGTISQAAHTRMIDQASSAYLRSQGAATGMGQRLGVLGSMSDQTRNRLQQMGFQVQDVAVQLAAGTSATTVFAQQGSQILSIFGPVGAMLGVLAAVGLPLLGAAFAYASTEADGLTSAAERQKTVIEGLTQAAAALRQEREMVAYGVQTVEELRALEEMNRLTKERALLQQQVASFTKAGRQAQAEEAASQLRIVDLNIQTVDAKMRTLAAERQMAPAVEQKKAAAEKYRQLQADIASMDISAPWRAVVGAIQGAINKQREFAAVAAQTAIGGGRGAGPGGPLVGSGALAALQAGGGVYRTGPVGPVSGGGGGGGGGGGMGSIDSLRQSLMTTEEVELESYTRRQEALKTALDQRLITEDEFRRMSEAAQQQHADKMTSIDAYRYGSGLDKAGAFMGDMANAMQGGNEKMLAIGKKFGAAEALINAWRAFNQTIADPSLPFMAKFAAGAKVLAAGMGAVKAIQGSGSGGGRGGAAAGGGASAAAAAPAQQNVQTLNFTLQNDSLGIGQSLVRQIAAQLNEAQRNGSTLIRATIS
jgi:hypothetical protein